tara:strand:+ start:641 stop:835 length:195 start_codon:yes stop_codon:yes gene_type:complete
VWNLIGEVVGFVRETVKRRFTTRKEREWRQKEKEIAKAVADGDANSIADLFKRLRRKGSSSERR